MDSVSHFIEALWASFHLSTVLALGAAGALGGLLLGAVGTSWVHHQGWMDRRARWHHVALKLQFLVVPCAGLVLGLMAGLIGGLQHEANRQIDRAQPRLQAMTSVFVADFARFVATWKDTPDAPRTPEELVNTLVRDYFAARPMPLAANQDAGWLQRMGLTLVTNLRAEVIAIVAQEVVVRGLVSQTGVNKSVATDLMRMRFDQFLKADFLAALLKQQVAAMVHGWWLALGIAAGMMAGLMGLEAWIARRMGWHAAKGLPAPGAQA